MPPIPLQPTILVNHLELGLDFDFVVVPASRAPFAVFVFAALSFTLRF